MTPGPPAAGAGDDDRVTPIGARRTSVADLQREVERLTQALALAEARSQPPPRSRVRTVRRLLLLAGLVLGMALLVDGILTIVWQEPITALQQSRDQGALRTDLKELQQTLAAAPQVARESSAARIRRQALTLLQAKRPDGSALGSVAIPRIGLKTVFVESTDHQALKKGPGHYRGTVLPGLYGTVGLAGHRTTYGAPFRRVDELSAGSRIILRMPYGRFTYKVTGTRITTPADASSLVSRAGTRRLVLTACHPLYSAAKRIVVSARLVSATPA
ncbi:MAG: class E sortase [Baekduia sp.]